MVQKKVSQSPKQFERTVEGKQFKNSCINSQMALKRFHKAQNSLKRQLKKTDQKQLY
jgi:hypothetical protein